MDDLKYRTRAAETAASAGENPYEVLLEDEGEVGDLDDLPEHDCKAYCSRCMAEELRRLRTWEEME